MPKLKALLFISLLLNLLCLSVVAQTIQNGLVIQEFKINKAIYKIEIAQTPGQLSIGLMGRRELNDKEGMLFIFLSIKQHGIWMKNMMIPLTVAWLDKGFKVIDVKKLAPCLRTSCSVYKSSRPAQYVLELNIKDKIKIGDQIYLNKQ